MHGAPAGPPFPFPPAVRHRRASSESDIRARVITLRCYPLLGAFDDSLPQELLKGKRVYRIRDHFFSSEEVPYLAMVVDYAAPGISSGAEAVEKSRESKRAAWRALLADSDLPLFNALQSWRAEPAKREGVPVYLICTNAQLARIVKARPRSLSEIGAIKGIGKAKLEHSGADLLALLSSAPERSDRPDPEAASAANLAGPELPPDPSAAGAGTVS